MKTLNRRYFLTSTAAIAAVGPSILFNSSPAAATEMPRVDPDDSQAKALSYVHESPRADNICANCQLYTGDTNAAWGPCALFPGKHIAAAGWCSAWTKKVG